jgi:hypothetical protein
MKIYKNFGELKNAPGDIYEYFLVMESREPPHDDYPFMDYYGGDVVLIEKLEELKEVNTTIATDDDSRWLNILETPDSFDSCRWIAGGRFVEIFTATTDAGGPSYFIPKYIADDCPNVLRSIELSKEAWS